MTEPRTPSLRDQLKLIKSGDSTAVHWITSSLEAIAQADGQLNAFAAVATDAIEQAQRIDALRASGQIDSLPLAGLPIAVKDNICTRDVPTTAGSKMLETFVPTYNATCVQQLINAGAVVVGKTKMDEFGMGSSSENPHFGATKNPWDVARVPGGSSGGSAVAVTAGMAAASLGSDTGGSIRQPAAFCGLTGLKPSYGRVSRFGLIAYASSLDQVGPICRSAEDCALLLDSLAGHDNRDSTSLPNLPSNFLANLAPGLSTRERPLRVGVCRQYLEQGIDEEIRQAILDALNVLKTCGAKIIDVQLPQSRFAVPAYYLIACCEASSNLSRYDGVRYTQRITANDLDEMYLRTRELCFGSEVKRRIMLGTFALSSGYIDQFYVRASKVRRLIKQEYESIFETVDVLLGPTTPTPPFKIGEKLEDPVAMYLSDVFTVSANLAGIPAISLPCGLTRDGLPIGMQLQAGQLNEQVLLDAAAAFQSETDWHCRRPAS